MNVPMALFCGVVGIVQITKYKIIDDFIWKYNIRYSNEQFKKKIPIQLEEHEQVWYNSGVMSHWNVESIARHSIKKVREFLVYNRFSTSLIDNYKEKGVWYWAEGNKELKTKSKELVVFQTTEVTSFNGYDNTVSYYEGPACSLSYMQITQLKNKKMVIEMEGKRTNNLVTTYESSATYEKE